MKFLGFTISREEDNKLPDTPIPVQKEDGALNIQTGGHYGIYVDIDGSYKSEVDLITKYRTMAMQPEMDAAIEDIINESIVHDERGQTVKIVTDELKQPDRIKNMINVEFETLIKMLDFGNQGSEIYRRWYVDGRLYYNVIIDPKNTAAGIQSLVYVDPRRIRKIRAINKKRGENGADIVGSVEEFYVYNEKLVNNNTQNPQITGNYAGGIKLAKDSIVYINSGLTDPAKSTVLSYLHKAIRPMNQLRFIEDATVIYKVSRAPERRVFYIDVGNMPRLKAEQYLKDTMTKFRNKIQYDSSTGEIRDDRRHQCLTMDTLVPLLDGRTLSLEEISKEYETNQLWAYSCDPITGKFSPGLITWAGVSRPNAIVMRITLDNGESIICTPDHTFPVWGRGLVKAEDLVSGDSMIPLYRRNSGIEGDKKNKEYEQIFDNDKKEWVFTHRAVSAWKDEVGIDNHFIFDEANCVGKFNTIHHKNINRFDNSPLNLVKMANKDHIKYHQHSSSNSGKIGGRNCYEMGVGVHNKQHPDYREWHVKAGKVGGRSSVDSGAAGNNLSKGRSILAERMSDEDFNEWFRLQQKAGWTEDKKKIASGHAVKNNLSKRGNDAQREQWKSGKKQENHNRLYKVEYCDSIISLIEDCAKNGLYVKDAVVYINNNTSVINEWRILNSCKVTSEKQKDFSVFNKQDLDRAVRGKWNCSFPSLKEQYKYRNHKIVSVEYLEDRFDTGCLTIDGDEIYHNNHTFALAAGIYTKNSMLEDFWLPRTGDGKNTEITTLPAGEGLGNNEDILYFEKKLYRALNVPVSRLEAQQGFTLGRSSEITRDELKFDKFIDRLRSKFSTLFDELLARQLALKGVCTLEEWEDFKQYIHYDFIKDNNFTELKEAELIQNRMNTLQLVDPYIGRFFSEAWVYKHVLCLHDDEISQMQKEMAEDQKRQVLVDADNNTDAGNGDEQDQEQQGNQQSSNDTFADINNKVKQFTGGSNA